MAKALPSSVIIVGSGVFGLGTAYELATRSRDIDITVIERCPFPAPDGSSIDSSRIIRADYASLPYAKLMTEAMPHWRGAFGAEGRYTESGLALLNNSATADTSAEHFLEDALRNVTETLGLKKGKKEDGGQITVFDRAADTIPVVSENLANAKGYVNWTSGWAHAEDGVKYMRRQGEALGRVKFLTAEVTRLLFSSSDVEGVILKDGSRMKADLTILATGAWTPALIDLRGIASATGQVMAYVNISPEEEAHHSQAGQPVLLCEDDGMFIIPPRDGILKVARHGYGYANPVRIPHPEVRGETITVSLPRTGVTHPNMQIPPEGDAACRAFLRKAIPSMGERPWTNTRICWYTDTVSGDWLISYHPKYSGLFVATGGSGHGYKFLPIIGGRIVDVIEGRDRDELGSELRKRWAWPKERIEADHVWTNDWRGEGRKGMVLDEEYAKGDAKARL
ncbi:unnamed protein product [Zymoseptoria tritici ST99CH_1E4]|uniref:FAD dependent oxidoreductase domain-containing protein n=1 Tax=Zymoseptoria tritici ST99CH_1E4 TaxID=1276532 RepID=A0A2H1FWI5_ZYMTR|nr:unnamed protein product [Zymoseptoria tritici ST99CH_1E4]